MLLTRKSFCTSIKEFTSSFKTVILPPISGSNICQILLTTYGNLRWYWRICFLDNKCSNRTIPAEINATPSLQTYIFPVSNISQRYKLEFSTVHLDSMKFLGIIKIAFSESCFQNSSSSELIPLDFTQRDGIHVKPSLFMVIAVLVLCLLILFVISLGIARKRRRFCLDLKSPDSTDKKVSIHDFLAAMTVEKTLEGILTEGNPNYRWYSHRLLKGTIVDIDKSQIQIHTLLGRGAFGEVFRGILLGRERNGKNTDIAIKRLSKSADQQSQDEFLLEALILFKFQHNNIVKCLGISSSNGIYMILLELMLGGDLKTFLRNTKDKETQKSTLKMSELLRLAADVACGLNYLESLHFVHRDIAARNCLLTNLGPNRVAKLGDFGLAKDILLKDYYRKEGTALLPIRWMPPEAFLEGYFTSKSDVWAFGVLMWEIFTSGFIPYPGLQNNAVMTFVTKGGRLEMPALCTPSIYDLMCCCWQSDPIERPSFQTIHRFLIMTYKKFQNDESASNEQSDEDRSSPRYCSKVFNEEDSSPLMLIDEICRGGM
ncbi:leukocyte tyrosine kinase receptor-like [Saccostrea echinata]|uniref:leukocyte tyrosine kinase receptor-like n=1 Tax=Saccostrea echinata TaxID=191078 RepID=UPI002A803356|nr:leukocyte tyrosine kinase receptor-like [Saccostrea echinata]